MPAIPAGGSECPAGLKVLGIVNFGFGAMALLGGVFGMLALPFWDSMMGWNQEQYEQPGIPEWARSINNWSTGLLTKKTLMMGSIVSLITAPLLFLSGRGYFKQRKVQGRWLGNLYAIIAIGGFALGLIYWNLGLMNAVELVYPMLTLILLNVVFKNDFLY